MHAIAIIIIVTIINVLGMMHNQFRDNHESIACNRIGDTLTFECTAKNGLLTIWRGSAFNCASNNNEIVLINSSIGDQTCNNEMITGQVTRHEGNNYISQLNVILTSDLIGQIIECASYNGSHIMAISSTTLDIILCTWTNSYYNNIIIIKAMPYKLINAAPLPPPDEISLALVNFGPKETTFSWSPVAPDCPFIHYNILASNCGSCPTITSHTNVTCTYLPSDDSMCSFAIQTVVCGNITGNWSKSLKFKTASTFTEFNSGCTCTGATAIASVFAIGLTLSVIVFTSIIIVLVKTNKKACRSDLASRRREQARLSSHEEPRRTTGPESTTSTTMLDHERAKEAIIATNKNIAYADVAVGQHNPISKN